MKIDLDLLLEKIPDFHELSQIQQLRYIAFTHQINNATNVFSKETLKQTFVELGLPKPTNYSRDFNRILKKKPPLFIKMNKGFSIHPKVDDQLQSILFTTPKISKPTNNLFPMELFDNTRPYVFKVASQASFCFDKGQYDASNVMLRRLLETLIIEAYERKGRDIELKDKTGNFFYLKDLIDICINDLTLNFSRNSKNGMKKLKNLGDLSAHNRRYIATKSDIDKNKEGLRIVIQELLHIIDYSTWH